MNIGGYAAGAYPLAKGYIAGNGAKYSGKGMQWIGKKIVSLGESLEEWGETQLKGAREVRAFIKEQEQAKAKKETKAPTKAEETVPTIEEAADEEFEAYAL